MHYVFKKNPIMNVSSVSKGQTENPYERAGISHTPPQTDTMTRTDTQAHTQTHTQNSSLFYVMIHRKLKLSIVLQSNIKTNRESGLNVFYPL